MLTKWPASLDLPKIYLALAGVGGDDISNLSREPWQAVPFDIEDIVKWGHIDRDEQVEDRTRRTVYLYSFPRDIVLPTAPLLGVTIRIQGFLVSHKIKPLGNYEGLFFFSKIRLQQC